VRNVDSRILAPIRLLQFLLYSLPTVNFATQSPSKRTLADVSIASDLLRGLKLLHSLLQTDYDAFERDDLGGGYVQLLSGVKRILRHEPLFSPSDVD